MKPTLLLADASHYFHVISVVSLADLKPGLEIALWLRNAKSALSGINRTWKPAKRPAEKRKEPARLKEAVREAALFRSCDNAPKWNLMSHPLVFLGQADAETITGFYSCKYTEADELFAMVRCSEVPECVFSFSKQNQPRLMLFCFRPTRFECKWYVLY